MDVRLLSKLLYLRARWKGRDHWSTRQIEAHQARALQDLRREAYAGSEFYRQHHAGLFGAPLSQLPPVTKADLMSHFDQAVTDPRLRLADVEEHLRNLVASGGDPGRPWRGRWWAAAGTPGAPGGVAGGQRRGPRAPLAGSLVGSGYCGN
jgi:phenylacetate-CoA ligase